MDHTESVPPRVRTITYFTLVAVAALALLAEGVSAIWLEADLADRVSRTAGVVVAVSALIGGGMGVTYRPTRNGAQASARTPIHPGYGD